ncbi:nucleoside recognition domain-containing protein [uncultured Lamprocystis sp.]|jgi:spore maturation protein SpmA|uniref:nucleoside recognition domain-containing protein n=1 Tax=uncultured Lamprocystis sp. TaxID=543132 RepID=UPI0025EDC6F2|nr:nucleoside recognition domain-containing protein [uncultured Lamprocystis sp.]
MLNLIWIGFFLTAFACALFQFFVGGQPDIFARLMKAGFDNAKLAFDIALGLTGVMCLWLGILKIGERVGFLDALARLLAPLFARLFPEVPPGHPALGSITMNMAANLLGLDNAATPIGIRAMTQLQTLNPDPDTASNAQILFLVINASSITLLPVTIFTYRAQLGAADPTDVFIPILMATYCSTLAGFAFVATRQRIRLDPVVLAWITGLTLCIGGLALYFAGLPPAEMAATSSLLSNFLLLSIIIAFLVAALWRQVNAYEAFIEGAKEGFQTAVTIIPYLVAMLVAIGLLRASGALAMAMEGAAQLVTAAGFDARWVDGLPTMLMKPLSGSGARAMMIETMQTSGADSFAGRLACIIQGSTETTFYVLAVYFGAVGIKRVRYAVAGGLVADLAGFAAAVVVAYLFFSNVQ